MAFFSDNLVDQYDRPIIGAIVSAVQSNTQIATDTTDTNGDFTLSAPDGKYTIQYRINGSLVREDLNISIGITDALTYAYDATFDILIARLLPGWTGDTAALNSALSRYSEVYFTSTIGGFTIDATIVVPPNGKLSAQGQLTPMSRVLTFTGPSLRCGTSDGTIYAGSVILENLWFVHAGRLGYTSGALSNLITSGASHMEIYGGQAARVINCGGYGMPYGLSFFHCGGIYIENPFWYGGVWNPNLAGAQESIAQIRAASSPVAHNVNVEIVSPEMYGGNSLGVQSRTIGSNTVQAILHCGPNCGILIEDAECFAVRGGFVGGYAASAVRLKVLATTDIVLRISFHGTYFDESNTNIINVTSPGAGYNQIDGLLFNGCDFNGQIVAQNGIVVTYPSSVQPVRRVKIIGCQFRAFLGAPIQLFGTDNCDIIDCEFAGYNMANNTTVSFSSGIYVQGAGASNIFIRNCQFGGGANFYTETNAVSGTTNLTGNGCQYGVYGDTGSTGTYAYLRARNLAKAGGSLVTGTLTLATP